MAELLALAHSFGDVGFPTLLVAILYGSYKGWWVWGHDCDALKVQFAERLLKQEQISERWQTLALRATSLTEETVVIAKKSAM